MSITHGIYKTLDEGKEVKGIFLDISKAFDRVWHEGLIFKLKQNGINGNLLLILIDFLKERKQRVVLNGLFSSWTHIKAGVPQGSILGPLLFLIYINDLPNGLQSNPKLFADDTSLFSVVDDIHLSSSELNLDLTKVSDWANQWKMSFNPDPSKQAKEVIFSHKINKPLHPNLVFNNVPVDQVSSQKHLGMILDSKLNFNEHFKSVVSKVSRSIALLRKLRIFLPRSSLIAIYKSFIRPHLDYGDILYDQAFNNSFHAKLESIQYKASTAILGVINGSNREKVYQELGLESLQSRRWMRKLFMFYKMSRNLVPNYLCELIPKAERSYNLRNSNDIPFVKFKHNFFKNSFLPSAIIEWNKLKIDIRDSVSLDVFKKKILTFVRPRSNSIFGIHNTQGVKYLNRLRVGLSHLREHKFKHGFLDTINPLCSCGQGVESTKHFFLHCTFFANSRAALLQQIGKIDNSILNENDDSIIESLLFGKPNFEFFKNKSIIESAIEYILSTERFDGALL